MISASITTTSIHITGKVEARSVNNVKNTHHTHTYTNRRYFQHAHFIPIVGVGKRSEY